MSAITTFSATSPIELDVDGSLIIAEQIPAVMMFSPWTSPSRKSVRTPITGLPFATGVADFDARARVGIGAVENRDDRIAAVEGFHQALVDPLGKIGQPLELLVADLGKEDIQRWTKPLHFRGKLFVEASLGQGE